MKRPPNDQPLAPLRGAPDLESTLRRIVREELEREREVWITRHADIEFLKNAKVGPASTGAKI